METKVCSKCEKEKPLLEYNVCSRVKDGRKAECRECQRISGKKYRFENKEKIKEYNTKWNKENQEYYKKYFEEYYTVNYDKEKERKLKWSRENRKYSNDYQKQRKKKGYLI
jgi:hypothetical protein